MSRLQLHTVGIDNRTIRRWIDAGYLFRVHPRVYAVGHRAQTIESDLFAAVLYAGPGAMLSHTTAAWWVGLATSKPYMIHVSTPRRCRSIPGIRVHQRRQLERDWHRNLPVTQFPQTMLDYAATVSLSMVRLALARADFGGDLNLKAIEAVILPGRPGGSKLRKALKVHQPMLANARSGLEIAVFEACEARRLPLPELNGEIAGWPVDLLWREHRLAVELDGEDNHYTRGQVRRDRRKEYDLREVDLAVLRYSDEQVKNDQRQIVDEIVRFLADRAAAPRRHERPAATPHPS